MASSSSLLRRSESSFDTGEGLVSKVLNLRANFLLNHNDDNQFPFISLVVCVSGFLQFLLPSRRWI